jgi:hypothetical protein
VRGLNIDCAIFALHPEHIDALGLHQAFDVERSVSVVKIVADLKARLRRPPFELRFEPPRALFFQMGDGGGIDRPSLGFGKRDAVHGLRLVPDPYFHRSGGYEKLRRLVAGGDLPPWRKRERALFWRGSATGRSETGDYRDLPRVRLAALCRDQRRTDVKICHVPAQVRQYHDPETAAAELGRARLTGDWVPMPEFARRRYTIDIDGNANAWGLFEKMLLGLCILKVGTPSSQWFYHRLAPWEHFIPVQQDLSDLPAAIEWCFANDREAAAIAEAAQRLALELTFETEMTGAAEAAAEVLTRYEGAGG